MTRREGQSEFRVGLIGIYSNKCCVTGENTPELLEAAHIQPYLTPESNHLQNGLLLRTDIHKLFDNGLLWIDHEYRVQVSSYIDSPYYKSLNGKKIHLPKDKRFYPSQEALQIKRGSFRA